MPFDIILADLALEELKAIRAFDRKRILAEMDDQLKHQPTTVTRNRKRLDGVVPDFEHDPPIWELRVGDYRVFYDVNEASETVQVRAVRQKVQTSTIGDIVHERDDP